MIFDNYNQVINGKETYDTIAIELLATGKCIIGWTDQYYDHRDILFTYKPILLGGSLQRGLHWCYLYISIIDFCSMGFLIENNTNNTKSEEYIMEKLRLYDNHCDHKICELVNGVLHSIDILSHNIKEDSNA
jgi:hypothetical protein